MAFDRILAWSSMEFHFMGCVHLFLEILEKNLLLPVLNHKSIAAHIFSHIYMILYILVSWTIFAISDFNQLAIIWHACSPSLVWGIL